MKKNEVMLEMEWLDGEKINIICHKDYAEQLRQCISKNRDDAMSRQIGLVPITETSIVDDIIRDQNGLIGVLLNEKRELTELVEKMLDEKREIIEQLERMTKEMARERTEMEQSR